jgi:hypothetical protein
MVPRRMGRQCRIVVDGSADIHTEGGLRSLWSRGSGDFDVAYRVERTIEIRRVLRKLTWLTLVVTEL